MRLLWEAQQQRRAGRARAVPPPINTNGDFMEGDEDDDQAPAAPTEEVPSSELEIPTGFADEAEYAAYLEMVIRDELRATSTAGAQATPTNSYPRCTYLVVTGRRRGWGHDDR